MSLINDMIRFRAANNMSQGEAAEVADVSKRTWCDVENGKHNPTSLTRAKIKMAMEHNYNGHKNNMRMKQAYDAEERGETKHGYNIISDPE